jgi:hypothetical protein
MVWSLIFGTFQASVLVSPLYFLVEKKVISELSSSLPREFRVGKAQLSIFVHLFLALKAHYESQEP